MLTITGANSFLGRALATALQARSPIRAVDMHFDAPIAEATCLSGDLRDAEFARQAAEGANAIIHLAPLYTRLASEHDSLDHATRGTYVLADAAARANVARFILGGAGFDQRHCRALGVAFHASQPFRRRQPALGIV